MIRQNELLKKRLANIKGKKGGDSGVELVRIVSKFHLRNWKNQKDLEQENRRMFGKLQGIYSRNKNNVCGVQLREIDINSLTHINKINTSKI